MKVLILSHNTGGGHNAVANALKEELEKNNIECVRAYSNISIKEIKHHDNTKTMYHYIIKVMPGLAKIFYIVGNIYSDINILPSKSIIYGLNKVYANNLEQYIEENGFNLVIATHLFPAETLSFLNKKRNKNIKFITINTDYVFIPLQNEADPDYCVIAAKDLVDSFVKKGMKKNKLLPIGIPVSSKFKERISYIEARKKLELPEGKKIVLIMNGSLGYGKVNLYIDAMFEYYKDEVYVIVVCAQNDSLKNKLYKQYPNNLKALGYINNINEYMDASDVVITKPGGLSITEAAVKNIPIILANAIPGWEEINAKYFTDHKMAYTVGGPNDLIKHLNILFYDKDKINKMKKYQSKYINKNATEELIKFLLKKYKNK